MKIIGTRAGAFLALVALLTWIPELAGDVESQPQSASEQNSHPMVEEVSKEVLRASERVESLIADKQSEVQGKTEASLTDGLVEAVRKWSEAPDDASDAQNQLLSSLEELRASSSLGLLAIVTLENQVLVAHGGGLLPPELDDRERFVADVQRTSEVYFREAKPDVGVEVLARYESTEGGWAARPALFIAAGVPVFLRPDAPHCILVGASSLASLEDHVRAVLDQSAANLDWQIFCNVGFDVPTVTYGTRSKTPVAKSLVAELSSTPSSTTPAFDETSVQVQRWTRLLDREGQLLGGWGVTADTAFLTALMSPGEKSVGVEPTPTEEDTASFAEKKQLIIQMVFLALAAVGFLGLLWVVIARWLKSRRLHRGQDLPTADDMGNGIPVAPVADGDDLLTRFEVNWKTFASYTQDLLRQTLKELEQSPERDVNEMRERIELSLEELVNVRKDLSRVHKEIQNPATGEKELFAQALVEIKNELSIARDELKNSSNGVIRKVVTAMNQKLSNPPKKNDRIDTLVHAMEGELHETRKGITILNETVLGLADVLGEKQEQEIQRCIHETEVRVGSEWKTRASAMEEQLASQGAEASDLVELRGKLDKATGREEELKKQIIEQKAKLEMVTGEREAVWKRERKLMEKLHQSELTVQQAVERTATLEATSEELQSTIDDLRDAEKELLERVRDTEETAGTLAEDALQEKQRAFEQREKQLKKEKRELAADNVKLERRLADLENEVGQSGERARLESRCTALKSELNALNKSLQALKDKNEQLERESNRRSAAGEKTKAQRSAAVDYLNKQVKKLEEKLARRESTIMDLNSQIGDLEAARKSATRGERESSLSREAATEWQARVESLEQQVMTADRRRTEVEQLLDENKRIVTDLETQLRSSHETVRTDSATLERLQNLKREKKVLVRSMEQLKNDLDTAKVEVEKARLIQGTLFDGHMNASLIFCERDLTVSAWNPAAERIWNQKADGVIGKNLDELQVPGMKEIVTLAAGVIESGNAAQASKITFRDGEGNTRHVRVSVDPVTRTDDETQGLIIATDDVTEEIEKDIEARLQSLFAESLTESLPCALIVLDGKNRVTSWNRAAEDIFGVSNDDAVGSELFELATPLKRQAFKKRFEKTREQGKSKKLRVRMDEKGKAKQCLVTQSPFRGQDGSVRGTLLLIETEEPAKAI